MVTIYTHRQQSPEWFHARLGLISASSFSKVMAKGAGKVRKDYMLKLAAEIITGTHRDTYQNADMIRGNEQEPQARAEYEFITGCSVDQIGFAKRGRISCSPDGLVKSEGGIEIKSVIPEVQIETVIADRIPPSHKPQVQGCMMVLDCEWWDFVSYSPLIKNKNFMFIKRMYRDNEYIATLESEIVKFIADLDRIILCMT